MFAKVAIVGVGLIGGSFALAARRAGLARRIVGVGRSTATLDEALALGLIDAAESPDEAIAGADLVLVAAPVAQTAAILRSIAARLAPDTVVTDAGSTKSDVIAAARAELGERIAQFVPGHPIAGSERNGPSAAEAGLFENRTVVLTPLPENPPSAVQAVRAMWESVGARVQTMSAVQHDRVLAAVSHLPHVLAFALVAQIAGSEDASVKLGFAGGGFRDFTRIAASSPEMWRDICVANATPIRAELASYRSLLERVDALLAAGDASGLERLFAEASRVRQDWRQG